MRKFFALTLIAAAVLGITLYAQDAVFKVKVDMVVLSFTVTDSGIGIPAADIDRLFSAFHRGQNVGQLPGSGLGLVIVKRCVDLHGGGIHVESQEGQGTKVTVKLPLFRSSPSTSIHPSDTLTSKPNI